MVRDATAPAEAGTDVNSPRVVAAVGAVEAGSEPMAVVAERAGRMVLKTLADADGVTALSATHEQVSAHHGNNYLPLLEPFYRSHRAALFTLVDTLALEATSADRAVLEAVEFIRAIRHRRSEWIPEQAATTDSDGQEVTVSVEVDAFAGDLWRAVLRDRKHPGMLARRHLEVCVFSHLAAELRCGDIAVAGADSFANFHAQLMSWQQCEPLAGEFCAQAGIPADAAGLTAFYRRKLARLAAEVDAGYPANTDLRLEGGNPVLARRKGADRRASASRLEEAVHERLPERNLLDIVARSAYLIGWDRHFGPASGSDVKVRDRLGRAVLTTFANGTLLGPAQVARHMRGQVSAHELSWTANKHATCAKIDAASVDVINEFVKLDVAGVWAPATSLALTVPRSKPGQITFSRSPTSATAVMAGWRCGTSPIPTLRCSVISFRAACGKRSTSLRDCCKTSRISSQI